MRVGLTGGIGSGKSTVSAFLTDLGATVIDADAIARSVTAPGGSAIEPIKAQFGPTFIDAQGALDRQAMRQFAFQNPAALKQLEEIVHPLVGQETRRQAALASSPLIVFDIPLLVESGRWRSQVDRVVVVDCEPQTQVDRVVRRSQLTSQAVRDIMARQATRERRLSCADDVIFNDGLTLDALRDRVTWLVRRFGL